MRSESGRPAAIKSWMWAVCEKRNGQNAKSTADVAAAQASPVRRRANSHIVTTEAAKVNRTTTLCAVSGLRVNHQAGRPITPAARLASENASVLRCGWKMFASKRSPGSVRSACATQATFQTDTRASPLLAVRPSRFRPVTSGHVMITEAAIESVHRTMVRRARVRMVSSGRSM